MADGVGDLPFFFAARACMGMGAQSAAHLQTEAAREQWRLRSNISLFFSFLFFQSSCVMTSRGSFLRGYAP
jgi:hypothetical protein